MRTYPLVAWAMLIMLALIWGSSFVMIKNALVALEALEVAAIRVLSAAIVMVPVALFHLKKFKASHYPILLLTAFLGVLFPAVLFAVSQTKIDSSLAGILNATVPLFTLVISVFIFKQPLIRKKLLGVVVGLSGCAFLIFMKTGIVGSSANIYALLVVLATVCYGTNVNIVKQKLAGFKPIAVASVSLSLIGIIAFIFLLSLGTFERLDYNPAQVKSLVYVIGLGVVATAFASTVFYTLIGMTDPVFSSSVTYMIPVVAALWGFILGENIGWVEVIGMMIILSGVYLVSRAGRTAKSNPILK